MKTASPGGMSEWQPIETVPRDIVLLYFPPQPADRYGHNEQAARLEVGRAGAFPFREPTHWMPLPDPPGEQETNRGRRAALSEPEWPEVFAGLTVAAVILALWFA